MSVVFERVSYCRYCLQSCEASHAAPRVVVVIQRATPSWLRGLPFTCRALAYCVACVPQCGPEIVLCHAASSRLSAELTRAGIVTYRDWLPCQAQTVTQCCMTAAVAGSFVSTPIVATRMCDHHDAVNMRTQNFLKSDHPSRGSARPDVRHALPSQGCMDIVRRSSRGGPAPAS